MDRLKIGQESYIQKLLNSNGEYGIGKFKCPECPKIFHTIESRIAHEMHLFNKSQRKPGNTKTTLKCTLCPGGTTYTDASKLKRHIVSVHSHNKAFSCRYCGNRFGRNDHRYDHETKMHKKVFSLPTQSQSLSSTIFQSQQLLKAPLASSRAFDQQQPQPTNIAIQRPGAQRSSQEINKTPFSDGGSDHSGAFYCVPCKRHYQYETDFMHHIIGH